MPPKRKTTATDDCAVAGGSEKKTKAVKKGKSAALDTETDTKTSTKAGTSAAFLLIPEFVSTCIHSSSGIKG